MTRPEEHTYVSQIDAALDGVEMPEPVAHRAWFDQDHGARWLFTLWPEEERLDVEWQPLFTADQLRSTVAAAVLRERESISQIHDAQEEMQSEIDALKAENERLRADAARYTWLTVNAYVGIAQHPKPHEVWCLRLPNPNNCNNLDAAIDAAMKGQP